MKYILVEIIKIYQKIPGPWHTKCRQIPTCSEYGIEAISTYGSIKGSWLTFKRVLRCNPWGTYGYDPVIKENKNEEI